MFRGRSLVLKAAACALLLIVTVSCSTRTMMVRGGKDLATFGLETFEDEPDFELGKVASFSNLKALEALHRASPQDREILVLLARSFGSVALAFIEDDMEEARRIDEQQFDTARRRVADFYGRGLEHAERALTLDHPGFVAAAGGSYEAWESYLASETDSDDLEALFWAFNLGGRLNASDPDPERLVEIAKLQVLAQRLAKIDETYFFAGARLIMGVLNASTPPTMGGSLARASEDFERVFEVTDSKFLLAKVLYARYLSVAKQEPERFESELRAVLEASPEILAGQRLITVVAKRRASRLLQRKAALFAQ
jgi:hypothetical protein